MYRRFSRTCTTQLRFSSRVIRRQSSTSAYDHLREQLPARRKIVLYDDLAPLYSHRLNISLASFVPSSWVPQQIQLPEPAPSKPLPPAHHLVYFNAGYPENMLLADGTDPNQSPGEPFVRRMWAGGYVRWPKDAGIAVDGKRYACVEGIRDVTIKGRTGEEKVFVGIERRFGPKGDGESEDAVRERLWEEQEDSFGESSLIERRNIVFMHERGPEELAKLREHGAAPTVGKLLKPQHSPTFTHTLTPTPTLLFRYSALTFNAHAIHLDPLYCREVEGHRNLLFHGPLSFTLLVTLLENNKPKGTRIASIEYRNLAPLYCSEPIRFCGADLGNGKYEVWAETPEGGVAVKGTARVE